MSMLEPSDETYREKIDEAIMEAVLTASMTPDGKHSVLNSGEVIQSCLDFIAFIASMSQVSATPTSIRQFAQECGQTIRVRTTEARAERADGAQDPMIIVHASEFH